MKQFATIGSPKVFADAIGPETVNKILEIVITSYYSLLSKDQEINSDWEEDRITADLFTEVTFVWKASQSSSIDGYSPHPQFPIYPKQNRFGSPRKIDFVFRKGYEEQLYFAFECKKVDRSDGTLTRKYVRLGMQRYINCNYSAKMTFGGMIGFLFNDQIDLTAEAINNKIEEEGMSRSDYLSKIRSLSNAFNNLYESCHTRVDNSHFIIYHLFLVFTPAD